MKTKLNKFIIENINFNNKKLKLITENNVENKTIINVDIQPEYENYITRNLLKKWVNFINKNAEFNNLIFLYNGYNTLGMIKENDYKMWLIELGIDEDIIYDSIFYDKGYAFFRYCMDSGIEESNIVDLIKYMIKHDINDSRNINQDMWNNFIEETNHSINDVRDLLENAGDMIYIPELMNFLKGFKQIILTGGGINECLKEVEVALMSLEKDYKILSEFTY